MSAIDNLEEVLVAVRGRRTRQPTPKLVKYWERPGTNLCGRKRRELSLNARIEISRQLRKVKITLPTL